MDRPFSTSVSRRATSFRRLLWSVLPILFAGILLPAQAQNDDPTITSLSDITVSQGSPTGFRTFTVGDSGTPANLLIVTATSSDPTLVPGAGISLAGGGSSRSINVTPAPGLSGTATITMSVADTNVPPGIATTSFVLTVNDAPTITSISNRTIDEDASTGLIPFTVADTETAPGALTVTAAATSSNANLLPSGSLVLGGSGSLRTLNVIPAANENGTATVTVTVTDAGGRTDSESFTLTVDAVNDRPTLTGALLGGAGSPLLDTASGVLLFENITIDDVDQGRPGNESITVTITNNAASLGIGTFPGFDSPTIVLTGTPASVTTALRAIAFDPTPNRVPVGDQAEFKVQIQVVDGAGTTPTSGGGERSVYVESANDSPQILASLAVASIPDSGDSRPFRLQISDADPGDLQLAFTVRVAPEPNTISAYGALVPAAPSFTGSATEAATWVQNLPFRPVPNSVETNLTLTFRFVVTDAHGASATNEVSLSLTGENGAPEIAGISPNVLRMTDDPGQAPFRPFSGVRIADADANGTQLQHVSLSISNLVLGSFSSPSLTSSNTLSGTPQQVTDQLRQVVFVPALRSDRALGETVSTRLTIFVEDSLGASNVNSATVLAITSVDGAPVISGIPASNSARDPLRLPPSAPVQPFAGVRVSDDSTNVITLTISLDQAAKGRLGTLVGPGGSFVEVAEGSGIYRMEGSPNNISLTLSNLSFEVSSNYVFVPSAPGGVTFELEAIDASLNTRVVELSIVLENEPRNHLVWDDTDETNPDDHPVASERGRSRLGTLRRAIEEAANNDFITFDLPEYPAVIRLVSTRGPLILRRNVTIKGPGADLLTINGDSVGDRNPRNQTRILQVEARAVVEGVTLADGYATSGGAISVRDTGELDLRYSAIVGSRAVQWGGAIDVDGGILHVSNSLFRGNRTDSSLGLGGGAISIFSWQDCEIRNATFSGNVQGALNGFGGGALYVEVDEPSDFLRVEVEHCTFAENDDLAKRGSSMVANVLNTMIVARNSVYADARGRNLGVHGAGQIVSTGGNVSDDTTRATLTQGGVPKSIILLDQSTDATAVPVHLGAFETRALRPVGGHLPAPDSPAVGRAVAGALVVDQRGALRDSRPDSGALELGASVRFVLNEIQTTNGPSDFLEFYALRDSMPADLSAFTVWVDGTLRHTFPPGTLVRPGAGVVVADDAGLPAVGGTPVQTPINALGGSLSLGLRGAVELRTPGTAGALVLRSSFIGLYADTNNPALNLNTGTNSITLRPQFLGFALVPHPVGGPSPGADSDGTPFGSSNSFPTSLADAFVVGEDDLAWLPVLENDADADGTDRPSIVDLSPLAGNYGSDAVITSGQLATVSVDPAPVGLGTPPEGERVQYDPRGSALLQSLPEGVERTDVFYYSVVDVGSGAVDAFAVNPTNAAETLVTSANHRLVSGQAVLLSGASDIQYSNVVSAVRVVDEDVFGIARAFTSDPATRGLWTTVMNVSNAVITAYRGTNGVSPTIVTSVGHGLVSNEGVVISGAGTAAYNGIHVVTRVDADRFSIPTVFVGNPASGGSWTATRSRIPTRISQGKVTVTVIGANDAPAPAPDTVPGEEETIIRIFGDGLLPLVAPAPVFDTDDEYAMVPAISSVSLLTNDDDVDLDDDATTLRIVGVLPEVFAIEGYQGEPGEVGITVTSAAHGLSSGDVILVSGYGGHPSYNGYHAIEVLDEDRFVLSEIFVDDHAIKGAWAILNDANRLTATSQYGAAVTLEIRVDRIETSIVYDPLDSDYLNGLAAGETAADRFYYAVEDSHGAVSFAAVTVSVAGRNDAPSPVMDPPSLASIPLPAGTTVGAAISNAVVNFFLPPESTTPGRLDIEIAIAGLAGGNVMLTDVWSTTEDRALDIEAASLLANDTDVDRLDVSLSRLSVVGVAQSVSRLGAILTFQPSTGVVRYQPSPALNHLVRDEAVLDAFDVIIEDEEGARVNSLVAVVVIGLNDPPNAQDDFALTNEETSVTVFPQLNDVDPDINGVAPDNILRILPQPAFETPQGALVTFTTNSMVFDPSGSAYYNRFVLGYRETNTFPYTVADGSLVFANDDTFKVQADGSDYELLLLANDSNLTGSGGALSVSSVGTPNHGGTVRVNSDGTGVIYQPQVDYVGDEVFPYSVTDENGNTDTGFVRVRVNVDRLNGNLQANADAFSLALGESGLLDVLANDHVIPEGGSGLVITRIVSAPAFDEVSIEGNRVKYVQSHSTAGYTSVFSYEVSGGGTARAIATVSVRVVDRRGTLAVRPDTFSILADASRQTLDVLANDQILPGSPVVLYVESPLVSAPAHGTVEVSADGRSVVYTPDAGYVGLDTFEYRALDRLGGTGVATVSISIGSLTTRGDFFSVPFDDPSSTNHTAETLLPVLANDLVLQSVPETLVISALSPATSSLGALRIAGDGKALLFDPAIGAEGEATFTYTVRDGALPGRSAQSTVTVIVAREGVKANPDIFTVEVNSTENEIAVLGNDAAFPDLGRRLAVVEIGEGLNAPNQGGRVRISDSGDTVIYEPAPNFSGEETFTYVVTDSRSRDTAKVVVRVASGALSANDDAYTVFFAASESGETVSFPLPVLANDRVLPDGGQVLRITGVGIDDTINEANAPDKGGEVEISADGTSLIYTPRQTTGFTYREHFTYEINDGTARRSQARVEVEVQLRDNVRDLETHDDAYSVAKNSSGNVLRVLANDDVLPATAAGWRILGTTTTAYGGIVENLRTQLRYTAPVDFAGTDSFSYTVSDGAGGTGTATVRVNVGDVPLCPDVFAVLSGSVGNELDVLANDAIRPELPGASYHLQAIGTAPVRGMAVISNSVVVYTPTGSGPYPHVDTFTYEVADDSGLVTTSSVAVTVHEVGSDRDNAVVRVAVEGVNDAPLILGTRCCFEVYQWGSVLPFAGVTLIEYDSLPAPQVLTLEILVSDRTHGYLSNGTATNLDPDNDGRYVFTGTADQLTSVIRALSFVPTVGTPSRLAAGGSEETRFTLRLSDGLVMVTDDVTTVVTRHPEIRRLTAPDGSSADEFGFSVGASRRTVSAGAPFDDDAVIQGSGNKTGTAHLFERDAPSSGAWGSIGEVFAGIRGIGDEFGYATDVDASGTVLAVGARRAKTGSSTTGAAYIFRRVVGPDGSAQWQEVTRLPAPPLTSGDLFGSDIALDASGTVAVVTAPQHTPSGLPRTGAAFVFARTSTAPEAWSLVATLKPPTGANDDQFGRSVSIHGDLISVGAPRYTPTNKKSGAVYLFRRVPAGTGTWQYLTRVTPAAGDNGDEFGHSVAVHGTWLASGARLDEANGKKSGTVYVYEQSATNPATWTQRALLQSGEAGIDDEYGFSVAMDDQFLVVGARREATAGRRAGALHVHGRDRGGPGAWGRLERLIPATVDLDDEFGFSVAIRQGLAAVGARRQQLDGRRFGATYVYQFRFNNEPVVRGELPDAVAYIEAPFSYEIPAGTFADSDIGDTLVGYSIAQSDGQPLPGWLSYDPATGRLSSTTGPSPLDQGVVTIRVTALDQDGEGSYADFDLSIEVPATFAAASVASPSTALRWSVESARGTALAASASAGAAFAPEADPDGDGESNLSEYLRASNPYAANSSPEAGWLKVERSGADAVIIVRHRTDDERLQFHLETSENLQTWRAIDGLKVESTRKVSALVSESRFVLLDGSDEPRYFRMRMTYR